MRSLRTRLPTPVLWAALGALLLIGTPLGAAPPAAVPGSRDGLQRRAAAVYALAIHAQWPSYRFRDLHSPLVVGVLDDTELAQALEAHLAQRTARRRGFQVENYPSTEALRPAHVLLVGSCTSSDYQRAQAYGRGRQMLLVAERDAKQRPAPGVALFEQNGRLGLQIDRASCARSSILLSPQILALSRSHELGGRR